MKRIEVLSLNSLLNPLDTKHLGDMTMLKVLKIKSSINDVIVKIESDKKLFTEETKPNEFVEGIELTEKELFAVLERNNVQKVGIQGEKFDPNLHQAVAQIPSAIQKDHIAEVFQPGFTLNGRVLRAAMVAVSAGEAN